MEIALDSSETEVSKANRPWWKKKRWLISLSLLLYVAAYIAEGKLLDNADRFLTSIDANVDEVYKNTNLVSGKRQCSFHEIYYFYRYQTCFLPIEKSKTGVVKFTFVYWRPNRRLPPRIGDSYHFKEPYASNQLLTVSDGRITYAPHKQKENRGFR